MILGAVKDARQSQLLRVIFAENMRAARLAQGFSQEKLAELAELDRTYISSVERARRNVSIDSIERICAALAVTASDMLRQH
jgi:transcriptional regulator with XRE-family HTH domain